MQKASSYLYPNRIQVHTSVNEASHQEWRIVYQRTIKIYKGLTNIIEFDIKNADQKRIDITPYTIYCIILDIYKNEIYREVLQVSNVKGIATITIPPSVFENINPQFFSYSLIINNNGVETPIYADTQFSAIGKMELIDGVTQFPIKQINIVSFDHDILTDTYSTVFKLENLLFDYFNINYNFNGFNGTIQLSISNDPIISNMTSWTQIQSETITDELLMSMNKKIEQPSPVKWLKISFNKTNTGTIDRITISL